MGRWPAKPSISAIRSSRGLRARNGSSGCPETWRPASPQRNPEGALPGLQVLEEYLQLRRQKSACRIDGMHEDFRRRPIRKKPDEFPTHDLRVAISRRQQADPVAPIGESAYRL